MTTRDRLLDAAAHALRDRGLARATTKEIAKQSGYSEATLYKHFASKTDLFLAVLTERTPGGFIALLDNLHPNGTPPVDNLERVALAALEFYADTFPIAGSLFSEPSLLAAHREALAEREAGPHIANELLARYLRAEQEQGRVPVSSDADVLASALLGACMQRAFLRHFQPPATTPGTDGHFARTLARTALADSATQ